MRPSDPRLRRHLAPARGSLLSVIGAGVVSSFLVLAQAWAVTRLVLAALGDGDVMRAAQLVVVVFVARAFVGWAGDVLAARAAVIVGTALRRQIVLAVTRQGGSASGEQAVLATRGVGAAEPYLTRYLPAVVLAAVLPPLTVAVIATQDLLSAGIVLLTLPLIPLFGALVGLATRDRAEQQWREMASLSGHFLDVVRGLPTLVAYRRARTQSAQIGEITNRYRRASLGTLRLAFASSAVLELVATLSVALVAVTVGVRLASGGMELAPALLVLLLAPEAYWPLRRMGAEFHAAAEGVATFEAASKLLEQVSAERVDNPAGFGEPLWVTDLSVTHPGRSTPALHSLTAEVPATGVTVITGPSGCGKSTLLAAVAGLLEPTSGSITVGGRPVAGTSWQSQIAWLPQRPAFVAGTIGDNLRLAQPEATDELLWSVLRRVALEERVRALPLTLDAPLGEDGLTLSGGERARLALARVVLADRPWTILDEPTAHLDELTERIIADTIVELGSRGAVVVVAHRPAMIGLADHVVALTTPPAYAAMPAPAMQGHPATSPARRPVETIASPESVPDGAPAGFGLSTVLGALASASGVALTATAGWLIVQASTQPAVLTLLVAIVGVRAFGLARPVLRYAERLRSHDSALRLLAARRVEVYNAIVPLTPARLGRRRGDVLTAIVDDVDSVVDRELRLRMPVRIALIVTLLAVAVATQILPIAGAVVAISCVVAGAGGYLVARQGASAAESASVAARADLSSVVVETIQIAPDLLMWQALDAAADRVASLSDRLGAATRAASWWLGAARGLVLAVSGLAVGVMAVVVHGAFEHDQLSGPMMALLILLPLALAEILIPVADAGALSAHTTAAAGRLRQLEHTAPAVRDTVGTGSPATYDIDVDRVRGRWQQSAQPTSATSLALRPGERVALVGPSGSGKSTLAALLLRFLDPASGEITMGGVSTRDMALDDVRRLTGLVDDDPHVFATTLVENVRFARPGASDGEVELALRDARLGGWLDNLPDGLATWLGDGHAQVSGGERARLAIARSLLAAQPVLVLDEPTAHLDHATATELAHEILSGPRSRAVLWITHADPGLDLADRVVSLGAPAIRGTVARDLQP